MRAPLRSNPARRAVSTTRTTPAPVRGWNARDSIASMNPADAVIMDNWFPSASDIMLRKGSAAHVTGIGGGTPATVETLAAYRPESGTQVLFGFAGTAAYNMSSAGAVGAAVLSSLTNARWQHVNVSTSGGHFLLLVNGADSLRMYDGTNWTTVTGVSTPAITGVTTSTLIGIHVHKERVWYIPVASLDVWYSAAGAFAGALTKLPLGTVFKKGGYLVAMGTWTLDGGDGSDDLAVFVTSEGEVAIYQGTDPASEATWGKIGVYIIGTPIGRRCLAQLGGDLLIITTDGVIPCSKLAQAKDNKAVAITDNIQSAMADAVGLYGSSFGWEATLYPGGTMMLLNVPIAAGLQQQFVMNTVTKRWARFRPLGANPGWPASCFEVFNGSLYFGTSGSVRKAWTGTSDGGIAIEGDLLPAFNYFGNPTQKKHFKRVRPIIGWDSNPAEILIGIDVDFIQGTPGSSLTLTPSSGGVWDTGTWDTSLWGGDIALNKEWYGVNGSGFAGALHMRVKSAQAQVRLAAVSYLFEPGAPF
jgi:hypothetical protein